MEKKYDFVIRAKKWQGALLGVFAAFGLVVVLTGVLLKVLASVNATLMIVLVCAGSFFLIIGGVGLVAYFKEKFELKDGVFYYIKPFKKSQSAAVRDIAQVSIRQTKSPYIVDVVFYDGNGNKLINFYDDGTAFSGDYFLRALQGHEIPLESAKGVRK